jgi:hypothetical protein
MNKESAFNDEQMEAHMAELYATDYPSGKPIQFDSIEDEIRHYVRFAACEAFCAFYGVSENPDMVESYKDFKKHAEVTANHAFQAMLKKGLLKQL